MIDLDVTIKCDTCKTLLEHLGDVHCDDCHDEASARIRELEGELSEAKSEIARLESELREGSP